VGRVRLCGTGQYEIRPGRRQPLLSGKLRSRDGAFGTARHGMAWHGMAWHGIVSTVRVSVAAVSSACHVTFRAAQEIAGIAFGAGTSIVGCIRPASFRAELT